MKNQVVSAAAVALSLVLTAGAMAAQENASVVSRTTASRNQDAETQRIKRSGVYEYLSQRREKQKKIETLRAQRKTSSAGGKQETQPAQQPAQPATK